MGQSLAERWEVIEDPYGKPEIVHRHAALPVPAPIIGRTDDDLTAECSECGESRTFPASTLQLGPSSLLIVALAAMATARYWPLTLR
jgi:hypothetical protein